MISAIRNDPNTINRAGIVTALCDELDPELITESCMWLEKHQWEHGSTTEEHKFARLRDLLRCLMAWSLIYGNSWVSIGQKTQREVIRPLEHSEQVRESDVHFVDNALDWSSLLPLLLRVRRSSPRSRALFLPQWMFEEAGVTPPPERVVWNANGLITAGHEPMVPSNGANDIVLGRKGFRALQRRLVRHRRFWDPEIQLRRAITDLESNVIYASDHINSLVLPSEDTLYVAHYFFALQRRLQRKVVSDFGPKFLEKGESGNVLQNNPDIPTSFEQRVAEFSGQTGVPVKGPLTPQIDHCCLLMERYVSLYGQGDRNKLVFIPYQRGGSGRGGSVRGGSGRGPVDDYNLLCDILKTLCKAAKEQGLAYPGPNRKFLAKDIMTYNHSFDDDAFANGRVPGWETWLAQRREQGIIDGMGKLKVSEDVEMSQVDT